MNTPRFNALAPHYEWIEAISFGRWLHRCRTAWLDDLIDVRRVLILGEGDGRFLRDFLSRNQQAQVHVIDASETMIELARRRIANQANRVTWQLADARVIPFPPAAYDLIVTNFFLDCFEQVDLENLLSRLTASLRPGGKWLVGDFRIPTKRFTRIVAQALLATMYTFFRLVTRLPAGRLIDPRPMLLNHGLQTLQVKSYLGGFLTSELFHLPPHQSITSSHPAQVYD